MIEESCLYHETQIFLLYECNIEDKDILGILERGQKSSYVISTIRMG